MKRRTAILVLMGIAAAVVVALALILVSPLQNRVESTAPVSDSQVCVRLPTLCSGPGDLVTSLPDLAVDAPADAPAMEVPDGDVPANRPSDRDWSGMAEDWFEANIVYNRITRMKKGELYPVLLQMSSSPELLADFPASIAGERTQRTLMAIDVMSAELTGTPGLSVSPSGFVRRVIDGPSPAEWQWSVKPESSGTKLLTLTVQAHFSDAPAAVKVYRDAVVVEVGQWQQIKDVIAEVDPVWKWLVGLIATLWAFYQWIVKRKWRRGNDQKDKDGPVGGTDAD